MYINMYAYIHTRTLSYAHYPIPLAHSILLPYITCVFIFSYGKLTEYQISDTAKL